jgi:hypothetical protein
LIVVFHVLFLLNVMTAMPVQLMYVQMEDVLILQFLVALHVVQI